MDGSLSETFGPRPHCLLLRSIWTSEPVAADKRSQAFGSLNIVVQAMRPELQYAGGGMLRVSRGRDTAKIPEHSHSESRAIAQLVLLQQHPVVKRSGTQRSTQSEKNKVTKIGDEFGNNSSQKLRHSH